MAIQNVFARREVKYLITKEQRARIETAMADYMRPDEFGRSVICSLYYDTPSRILIRRSLEAPVYKEKLRVRSYGPVGPDDTVYVEIKKKYKHVTYKRRAGTSLTEAERWLSEGIPDIPPEVPARRRQILSEIDYFRKRYAPLAPAMMISCEREAFYAKDDREFRVTFDENILARADRLSLTEPIGGEALLEPGTVLMELKAGGAIPLWMAHLLSEEKIFKTKFSKYGTAFRRGLSPMAEAASDIIREGELLV